MASATTLLYSLGLAAVAVGLGCGPSKSRSVDAGPDDARSSADGHATDSEGMLKPSGASCAVDPECASGLCGRDTTSVVEDDSPAPLSCAVPGRGDEPGARCVTGDHCRHGLCTVAGHCVRPCLGPMDCETDELCTQVFITGRGATHRVAACVARFACPELDVRPGMPTRLAGFPDGTEFTLDGAGDMVLYVIRSSNGTAVNPVALAAGGRDGTMLFGPESLLNPIYGAAPLTVLLPNAPHGITAPTYWMELTGSLPTVITLDRVGRVGTGSVFDLDVFYIASGWAPKGPRGPALLATALDEVDRIFAPAGLRVGVVREHLVEGSLRSELQNVDALDDLDLLGRLTSSLREPSIPLFLLDSVGPADGLTVAVPGAQCVPGTRASGISIAVGSGRPVLPLGRVIAHEVGHFLGLFHTTDEQVDWPTLEPLLDTPACDGERDADSNLRHPLI